MADNEKTEKTEKYTPPTRVRRRCTKCGFRLRGSNHRYGNHHRGEPPHKASKTY